MRNDAKIIEELRQEVRYLRDELRLARDGILQMLPEHLQDLLDSSGCKDDDQLATWNRETIAKVIDLAEPIMRSEVEIKIDSTPRAYCPLCDADSVAFPWIKGYAIPKGLEMHLDGVGNTRRCPAMHAAFQIGVDRLRHRY